MSNINDRSSAAAGAGGGTHLQPSQQQQQLTRAEWLQEKCLDLLLVLAHADSVVKGLMCSKDNLQHLLDLTQKLRPPGLMKVRGSSSSSCLGSDSVCVCVCLLHTCTGVCWQGLCRLSRYAGQEAAHVQRHLVVLCMHFKP